MSKFIVFDPGSENSSPFYFTLEDAKNDLNNNISFQWSTEAEILEAEVR